MLKDRKIRISILLPPIIQLVIFTYAATLDVKNVPIGILNRDHGKQGFELVQRFYGTPTFNHHIHFLKGVEEITPFIDQQRAVMVVSIDPQFSRALDAHESIGLQLILDGRKSNTAQIVAGYATEIVRTFCLDYISGSITPPPQKMMLIPRTWFNPNLLYFWYNIPCLVGVLSMLICLVVTTQSVAREREIGTFDQLLVSPLQPLHILIGKIVPGILVGFAEGITMLTLGTVVLGVPFEGSVPLYLISLLIFVTSISGIGLCISSLSSTQQQAMLGTFVFMLPSVLISGFATPIENMPSWLQPVTYLIPLRYMLVISKGIILKAMPASFVIHQLWPLICIGTVNLFGAAWFFRRTVGH